MPSGTEIESSPGLPGLQKRIDGSEERTRSLECDVGLNHVELLLSRHSFRPTYDLELKASEEMSGELGLPANVSVPADSVAVIESILVESGVPAGMEIGSAAFRDAYCLSKE